MTDEQETAQEKSEDTASTENKGSELPTTSLISRADQAAERLEKALRQERENLKLREGLMARDALSGNTGGHIESAIVSEAVKKKQGAAKFFQGTELEKAILEDGKK